MSNFSTELHGTIAQFNAESDKLFGPIEPDILGEYFIINFIEPNKSKPYEKDERLDFLLYIAWNSYASQTGLFVLRTIENFEDNKMIEILLKEPKKESSDNYQFCWSTAMPFVIERYAKHKNIVKLGFYLNKLFALAEEV